MTATATNRPRRDPLKVLVDLDSMRLGHELSLRGATQWPAGYLPQRPLGVVKFEVARQVATFLLPLLFLLGVLAFEGVRFFVYALPVAVLMGAALDYQLTSAIVRQRSKELVADQGCYELVRELAYRLGLQREEITAARIVRLAEDYTLEERRLAPYALRGQQRGLAERAEREARIAARAAAREFGTEEQAIVDGVMVPQESLVYTQTGAAQGQETPLFQPQGGPATNLDGMPMLTPGVDIMGRTFGQ